MNQHLSEEEMLAFFRMMLLLRFQQLVKLSPWFQSLAGFTERLAQVAREFRQLESDYPGLAKKAPRHLVIDECDLCRCAFEQILIEACAEAMDNLATEKLLKHFNAHLN